MIWPEIWPFVLAVVLAKKRWKNQVNRILSTSEKRKWQTQHDLLSCKPDGWGCTCSQCLSDLGHFDQWVRIA